jgi:hypothetical protein
VARGLFVGKDFLQAVAELIFALLITQGEMETEKVTAQIAPVLAEQGWNTGNGWGGPRPIDERGSRRDVGPRESSRALGCHGQGGDWRDSCLALTDFGAATDLEGLRARSVAPRRELFA